MTAREGGVIMNINDRVTGVTYSARVGAVKQQATRSDRYTPEERTEVKQSVHTHMVNVSDKQETLRSATAYGEVIMNETAINVVLESKLSKSDILTTARIAGIMGAKRTSDLIPMCHNIVISGCEVDFDIDEKGMKICIFAKTMTKGQSGVELEALTAVSIAAISIIDMCKSYDREITLSNVCILKKEGGSSGLFEKRT